MANKKPADEKPKTTSEKPAKPAAKSKEKKKGQTVAPEGRARMAELAKKADPKCAEMKLLVGHPRGMDGRTIASLTAAENVSECLSRLNYLVYAGYARKAGSIYQPTPKGTTEALKA